MCVDGNTLQRYDGAAGCTGNACVFPSHVLSCPFGCASGACQADPCVGVTCPAPSSVCTSASELTTTSSACVNGACPSSSAVDTCATGCANGACSAPTCGSGTCDSPPTATCLDPSFIQGAAAVGTCSGTCSYASMLTYCSTGCINGSCDTGSPIQLMGPQGDPDGGPWISVAFAVDAADRPHLVGADASGAVAWVHLEATGWVFTPVDSSLGHGVQVALALDGSGSPVVAYYEPTNQRLRYAELRNGVFHVEEVSLDSPAGESPQIAVDPSGTRWIAYEDYQSGSQGVRVAHGTSGSWTIDNLGEQYILGGLQLALAPDGTPHVVAGALTSENSGTGFPLQTVSHAVRTGGTWQIETLTPHGLMLSQGLTFAANGDALLAYAVDNAQGEYDTLRLRREGAVTSDALMMTLPSWSQTGQPTPFALYDGARDLKLLFGTGTAFVRAEGEFWSSVNLGLGANTGVYAEATGPTGDPRFLTFVDVFAPAAIYGYAYTVPPACVPQCSGVSCGSDGCGGSCGTCDVGLYCGAQGQCSDWYEETVNVDPSVSAEQLAFGLSPGGAHHLVVQAPLDESYYGQGDQGDDLFYQTDANGPWSHVPPQLVSGQPAGSFAQALLASDSVQVSAAGTPGVVFGYAPTGFNWQINDATDAPADAGWPLAWSDVAGTNLLDLYDVAQGPSGPLGVLSSCPIDVTGLCLTVQGGGGGTTLTTGSPLAANLAFDTAGNAYVLWTASIANAGTGESAATLEYSTNASGAWVTTSVPNEVVTNETGTGAANSDPFTPRIAVGPNADVHIAFLDAASSTLEHGLWGGSGFNLESINSLVGTPSLVVDGNDTPTVLVLGATSAQVLRQAAGTWTADVIPVEGAPHGPQWLGLDAAGRPHAFFIDNTPLGTQIRLVWSP